MIGSKIERVLVLSAHTDDEQACGGTIVRAIRAGLSVHHVIFSACEESVPEGFPTDVLRGEARQASLELGIPAENVRILDYRVRHFPALRQEILEEMVRIRRTLSPDLVILPSRNDIHQDHQTIATEGVRAFKFASILGYELPMNNFNFPNQCYVSLDREILETKLRSIRCYRSQEFRSYMNAGHFESLARLRGTQAGVEFAECFEVIRMKL